MRIEREGAHAAPSFCAAALWPLCVSTRCPNRAQFSAPLSWGLRPRWRSTAPDFRKFPIGGKFLHVRGHTVFRPCLRNFFRPGGGVYFRASGLRAGGESAPPWAPSGRCQRQEPRSTALHRVPMGRDSVGLLGRSWALSVPRMTGRAPDPREGMASAQASAVALLGPGWRAGTVPPTWSRARCAAIVWPAPRAWRYPAWPCTTPR